MHFLSPKNPISDVREKKRDRRGERFFAQYKDKPPVFSLERGVRKERTRRRAIGIAAWGMLAALCMVVGWYGYGIVIDKDKGVELGKEFYREIDAGVAALGDLEFARAHGSFTAAREHLDAMSSLAHRYRAFDAATAIGTVAPKKYAGIARIGDLFAAVERSNELAISITEDLDAVKRAATGMMGENADPAIVDALTRLRKDIAALRELLPELQDVLGDVENVVPAASAAHMQLQHNFISADLWLMKTGSFLDALVQFLSGDDRHVVVLFQNPSEIRATGGFIGSYTHVTLREGVIAEMDVRDIYDPDGQLHDAIIPPKQIQGITTVWGARDANWFFDFPTSMTKFLELLERSLIYEEQGIAFQGALAINTNLVEDILRITGPIPMPEYDMMLSADNFLEEVQKEVEAGEDKFVLGQPKRILGILAPRLIERLSDLSDEEHAKLMRAVMYRTANKEIQVYFKNPVLQSYVRDTGIAGAVFPTPPNRRGDYLAVVNSNIAGGKTDILMSQHVHVTSFIDLSGEVRNTVRITRAHERSQSRDWWYRQVNQNFLRLYTPPGARLELVEGFSRKRIFDSARYGAPRYSADPLLAEMERTAGYEPQWYTDIYTEGDKRVFGTWLNVAPGETRELVVEYTIGSRVQVGNGTEHTFVLEKQSGVESGYEVEIYAPVGYYWRESGESVYRYAAPEVFSREVVRLVMERRE